MGKKQVLAAKGRERVRRAIVIGGGFAGLSAAVELSALGIQVDLLEGRKHLGGRARSFAHGPTGDTVDNGQHVFMRCYGATLDFLARIGAADRLVFQETFHADFSHPDTGPMSLAFPRRGPAAVRVLTGFLRFGPFRLADLPGLARVARSLKKPNPRGDTVEAWLDEMGQSEMMRTSFWEPLCISTLNRRPEAASADDLRTVLREAFFGPPDGAAIGHAGVDLSALYTNASADYVAERAGSVRLGASAQRISRSSEGGLMVGLKAGESLAADALICAVPPPALTRLLPAELGRLIDRLNQYRASPILSVDLWLDRPVLPQPMLGLLGTRIQWAFTKSALCADRDRAADGHIALVASAADKLVGLSDEKILKIALGDLRTHLPEARVAHCLHSLVVRERRATFDLPPGIPRPGNVTDWPGLFVAGDWTDTELPATIESAVRSGQSAARLLADHISAG